MGRMLKPRKKVLARVSLEGSCRPKPSRRRHLQMAISKAEQTHLQRRQSQKKVTKMPRTQAKKRVLKPRKKVLARVSLEGFCRPKPSRRRHLQMARSKAEQTHLQRRQSQKTVTTMPRTQANKRVLKPRKKLPARI